MGTAVRAHLQHSHLDPPGQWSEWSEFGVRWATVYQAAGMVSIQLQISPYDALIALRADAYVAGQTVGDIAADVVNGTLRFKR